MKKNWLSEQVAHPKLRNRSFLHPILLSLTVLFLLGPTPSLAIWPFERDKKAESGEDLGSSAARILSAAIRFNTTNPPGNERPLAKFMVDLLKDGGIETRLIETPPGTSSEGRAAVWGRYRGTSNKPAVVLLSHLDVVPANSEDWIANPFDGLVGGGIVLGRGAIDAKGLAVIHLLTMLELARNDEPLSRDVIFLAVPDEETGGQLGANYLVQRHANLVENAGFLLTEGGSILPQTAPNPDLWGISFIEKTPCWIELSVTGQAGHGSTAGPDASVPVLVKALERVRRHKTRTHVVPEVALMFEALAPFIQESDQPGYRNLAQALQNDVPFRKRFLQAPVRRALVHNTVAITVLQGSRRTNVMPNKARAEIDIRMLPRESCSEMVGQIHRAIDDPRVEHRTLLSFSNKSSPLDSILVQAIQKTAAEAIPPGVVVPKVSAGFTDAHYFRDLGIASYGFSPIRLSPKETKTVHGINERIPVRELVRGINTLLSILYNMDTIND